MSILIVLFGLLSDCLLSVLVGIIGSSRRIGFGLAFLVSLIFTPLVGLIITLLTDPLPYGGQRWGCVGTFVAILGLLFLCAFLILLLAGGAVVAMFCFPVTPLQQENHVFEFLLVLSEKPVVEGSGDQPDPVSYRFVGERFLESFVVG